MEALEKALSTIAEVGQQESAWQMLRPLSEVALDTDLSVVERRTADALASALRDLADARHRMIAAMSSNADRASRNVLDIANGMSAANLRPMEDVTAYVADENAAVEHARSIVYVANLNLALLHPIFAFISKSTTF